MRRAPVQQGVAHLAAGLADAGFAEAERRLLAQAPRRAHRTGEVEGGERLRQGGVHQREEIGHAREAVRAVRVVHVLDRFHIMSHFSKAIDEVRAAEAVPRL